MTGRVVKAVFGVAVVAASVVHAGCSKDTPPTPTLRSVAVSGVPTSLVPPNTVTLTATATLSDGSSQNVTASAAWDSSNIAVATVASGGVVTARTPGTTEIGATHQGMRGFAPLTVTGASLRANPGGPYQVQHNTDVTVSGLASTSSPFPIATYTWNCGQSVALNCLSTGPTPTFRYRKCGISGRPACRSGSTTVADYTVTLTITDTQGNTNSATTTVTVTNNY
jgi:hypothetical protein